jgi:uncharacterized protein YihD (DUF1040 family)
MSKKLYSFRLPPELMDAFREKADAENLTVTELLTRIIGRELGHSSGSMKSSTDLQLIEELRQEMDQKIDQGISHIKKTFEEKLKTVEIELQQLSQVR